MSGTASLRVACACGATASAPCPTVADIPAAQETFAGWGYDDHGFARCPECIAAGPEQITQPAIAPVDHGPLFTNSSQGPDLQATKAGARHPPEPAPAANTSEAA